MALKKDIPLVSGVVANYIRVVDVLHHINDDGVSCGISYAVYLDEEHRRNGSLPLETKTLMVDPASVANTDFNVAEPKHMYYVMLKNMPEMAGSLDC